MTSWSVCDLSQAEAADAEPKELSELMKFFGRWTRKYFAWRGTSDKPSENEQEIDTRH
jgi:hypothetical protein